ncbi:unnamed protein product, partial [marine sediment metagenome]
TASTGFVDPLPGFERSVIEREGGFSLPGLVAQAKAFSTGVQLSGRRIIGDPVERSFFAASALVPESKLLPAGALKSLVPKVTVRDSVFGPAASRLFSVPGKPSAPVASLTVRDTIFGPSTSRIFTTPGKPSAPLIDFVIPKPRIPRGVRLSPGTGVRGESVEIGSPAADLLSAGFLGVFAADKQASAGEVSGGLFPFVAPSLVSPTFSGLRTVGSVTRRVAEPVLTDKAGTFRGEGKRGSKQKVRSRPTSSKQKS